MLARKLKSQAGVEFAIIMMFLIAFAAFVLAKSFQEHELNIAIATARTNSESLALRDNTAVKNINYTIVGNRITIIPNFFDGIDRSSEVRIAVKSVLAPKAPFEPPPDDKCFKTTRLFCVI